MTLQILASTMTGMLASILPGIRDLRTPLIVGYLLFLDMWLLFYRAIPERGTNAFSDSIYRLVDVAGATAMLSALSFICYIIGSILVIPRLPYLMVLARSRLGVRLSNPADGLTVWLDRHMQSFYDDPLVSLGDLFQARVVSEGTKERFEASASEIYRQGPEYDSMDKEHRYYADMKAGKIGVRKAIEEEVRSEFPLLTTRLQIEQSTVYSEYDRLRSEAQFRYSIFFPMLGLIFIGSVQWSAWITFAVVLPLWLLADGYMKQIFADRKVWDSLTMGFIASPTVEAFDRWPDTAAIADARRKRLQAADPHPWAGA